MLSLAHDADLDPDLDKVIVGLNNGRVEQWAFKGKVSERGLEAHSKGVKALALSETFLITGSYDHLIKVWDKVNWRPLATLGHHEESVWDLAVCNRSLATCGLDGNLALIDLDPERSFPLTVRVKAQSEVVSSVDLNETFIVTGCDDSSIGVYDAFDASLLHTLTGHSQGNFVLYT